MFVEWLLSSFSKASVIVNGSPRKAQRKEVLHLEPDCANLSPPSSVKCLPWLCWMRSSPQLFYRGVGGEQHRRGDRQTPGLGIQCGPASVTSWAHEHHFWMSIIFPSVQRLVCSRGPSQFWHIPGLAMSNFTNCSRERHSWYLPKHLRVYRRLSSPYAFISGELEETEARSRCPSFTGNWTETHPWELQCACFQTGSHVALVACVAMDGLELLIFLHRPVGIRGVCSYTQLWEL